jgi:hypothetical protein
MTAVEWLLDCLNNYDSKMIELFNYEIERAKEMEKQDLENKAIHFAEWLTKKHTTTLMIFYEQFEEEFYK